MVILFHSFESIKTVIHYSLSDVTSWVRVTCTHIHVIHKTIDTKNSLSPLYLLLTGMLTSTYTYKCSEVHGRCVYTGSNRCFYLDQVRVKRIAQHSDDRESQSKLVFNKCVD